MLGRGAFTLIEVLVTIGVLAALLALAMPAFGLVRRQAQTATTAQLLRQVVAGCEQYRSETGAYPTADPGSMLRLSTTVAPAGITVAGPLALLLDRNLLALSGQRIDSDGSLRDPWGAALRYALVRPTPVDPPADGRGQDWNWDAAVADVRRRGERCDWHPQTQRPLTRTASSGRLPYPYAWSLGPDGQADNARTWIYLPDGG